jgi:prepilin-type N-terminal cleavage/methylation domain-containing protein/prepilin-type processing-associated H-X9-DG protein
MRRRAFTLIELLVVIAIIALLAAILFPVFARARENARRSTCQSNLKQIAIGIVQYTQDYDERYPGYANPRTTPPAENVSDHGWALNIQPYIKSPQVYQCPSEQYPPLTFVPSSNNYIDYAINENLTIDQASVPLQAGAQHISVLLQPSLSVLLFDRTSYCSYSIASSCLDDFCAAGQGLARFDETGTTYVGASYGGQRHLDGQNFAFCDGHVKWYKGIDDTHSAKVYNWATPFSSSGDAPTFNFKKP